MSSVNSIRRKIKKKITVPSVPLDVKTNGRVRLRTTAYSPRESDASLTNSGEKDAAADSSSDMLLFNDIDNNNAAAAVELTLAPLIGNGHAKSRLPKPLVASTPQAALALHQETALASPRKTTPTPSPPSAILQSPINDGPWPTITRLSKSMTIAMPKKPIDASPLSSPRHLLSKSDRHDFSPRNSNRLKQQQHKSDGNGETMIGAEKKILFISTTITNLDENDDDDDDDDDDDNDNDNRPAPNANQNCVAIAATTSQDSTSDTTITTTTTTNTPPISAATTPSNGSLNYTDSSIDESGDASNESLPRLPTAATPSQDRVKANPRRKSMQFFKDMLSPFLAQQQLTAPLAVATPVTLTQLPATARGKLERVHSYSHPSQFKTPPAFFSSPRTSLHVMQNAARRKKSIDKGNTLIQLNPNPVTGDLDVQLYLVPNKEITSNLRIALVKAMKSGNEDPWRLCACKTSPNTSHCCCTQHVPDQDAKFAVIVLFNRDCIRKVGRTRAAQLLAQFKNECPNLLPGEWSERYKMADNLRSDFSLDRVTHIYRIRMFP